MNLIKRLFFCNRGIHEIAGLPSYGGPRLAFLPTEPPPGPGVPSATDVVQGNAYFVCDHCGGRFVKHGPLGRLMENSLMVQGTALAESITIPEDHKVELAKLKWWRDAFKPAPRAFDGCYHGGAPDPTLPLPLPPGPGHSDDRCPATAVGDHFMARGVEWDVIMQGKRDEEARLAAIEQAGMSSINAALGALAGADLGNLYGRPYLKDAVYIGMAELVSLLGTCCRLKVGAVLLTDEGRVAGVGYNGAGPGMPHCEPGHCNETCRCIRTVHAEENALHACSGVPHTAYVTAEPCLACTKSLLVAGVRRVVYLHPYTSIAEAERTARQEWIDHYQVEWLQHHPQQP